MLNHGAAYSSRMRRRQKRSSSQPPRRGLPRSAACRAAVGCCWSFGHHRCTALVTAYWLDHDVLVCRLDADIAISQEREKEALPVFTVEKDLALWPGSSLRVNGGGFLLLDDSLKLICRSGRAGSESSRVPGGCFEERPLCVVHLRVLAPRMCSLCGHVKITDMLSSLSYSLYDA